VNGKKWVEFAAEHRKDTKEAKKLAWGRKHMP